MIARLHPRHHIDIEAAHLVHGLDACLSPPDETRARGELEALVDPAGRILATLSVRSAFDLLLSALALAPGDEVLLSALTIPDMARLVRAHGLVPVPVDVDPSTLTLCPEALEAARSPRTRMLVVAQLLGNHSDFSAARRFATQHGLCFVDDSAQAYLGPESLRVPDHQRGSNADVVLHSFGSIKTSTCLGGALAYVRDDALRRTMRARQATWPLHDRAAYARKLALYLSLQIPREPHLYTLFAAACERSGQGLDAVVTNMTKGFPARDLDGFLAAIRRRPSPPLLALLRYRVATYDPARVALRSRAGEQIRAALTDAIPLLGQHQSHRTHWLLAILVDDPQALVAPLRKAGFDAARGATTLAALPAPPERPTIDAPRARHLTSRVLFLPTYPEIPTPDLHHLTSTLLKSSRK